MDGKGGWKTIEGGWEEYTTMVYGESNDPLSSCTPHIVSYVVDQPAGTGYSYTSTNRFVHTLDEVCARLVYLPRLLIAPGFFSNLGISSEFLPSLSRIQRCRCKEMSLVLSLVFIQFITSIDIPGWRKFCWAVDSSFR